MVMVFFHGNLGFSQFSICHPVADLLRRTDAVGICRDLLAIDARIRLLSDFRAFRYAWTCRGDCGGWNRSGEKGKLRLRLKAMYRARTALLPRAPERQPAPWTRLGVCRPWDENPVGPPMPAGRVAKS